MGRASRVPHRSWNLKRRAGLAQLTLLPEIRPGVQAISRRYPAPRYRAIVVVGAKPKPPNGATGRVLQVLQRRELGPGRFGCLG